MTYLDASILVSALTGDVNTARARAWLAANAAPLIVSDLAALEVASVVSRGLRTGRFGRGDADAALRDFDDFRRHAERLGHRPADFALAESLIRAFDDKLATQDALHLASAINARATLATFDARLAAAAKARGVEVAEMG